MNYWIFIVTEYKEGRKSLGAEEIFKQRMDDGFWGLAKNTPNRTNLHEGDKVVYYIGKPKKVFAGTSTLESACFELNESDKTEYWHKEQFLQSDYGVRLKDIDVWNNPKPIEELVPKLNFIENKKFWYTYFQGGIRQITEEDFKTIIGERETTLQEQLATAKEIESEREFALEEHLEEFIYQNWSTINWDSRIELYETEEQDGRQFPAGTWNIDLLAVDKDKNDLVVIELKRGRTSDKTVGQILRYMSWVEENVAEKGQNVRGIIIANDIDKALSYAIKHLEGIDVKTYKVDFTLMPVEKKEQGG